jgi:predicted RNA-binding protein with PIN domain
MIIIIDGYNLLKQIFPGSRQYLDKQKNVFIRHLALYKSKKSEIKEIIIVFDAGPSTHATREIKNGIVVMYSGTKSNADEWIQEFVERNKGKDMLVVTLDRALKDACKKFNADSLSVYDFYGILKQNLIQEAQHTLERKQTNDLEKYESIELDDIQQEIPNQALDLLMEQASVQIPHNKNDEPDTTRIRTKKTHTPSKEERLIQKKLKKII